MKFRDWAADLEGPESGRMHLRTKPHVKAEIQQAAGLLRSLAATRRP